jgi:hypothetical protein
MGGPKASFRFSAASESSSGAGAGAGGGDAALSAADMIKVDRQVFGFPVALEMFRSIALSLFDKGIRSLQVRAACSSHTRLCRCGPRSRRAALCARAALT